jgi:hypothetical protein
MPGVGYSVFITQNLQSLGATTFPHDSHVLPLFAAFGTRLLQHLTLVPGRRKSTECRGVPACGASSQGRRAPQSVEARSPQNRFPRMISLSNISQQYGRQLVFGDASFQLNPARRRPSGSEWSGQDYAVPHDCWEVDVGPHRTRRGNRGQRSGHEAAGIHE